MFTILKADVTDAELIITLQFLAYQSEAILYNDWSLPPLVQTVASLHAEFEHSIILKVVVNDSIIGSVRATMLADVCKIGRLIVHPEFQRQGIGASLLNRIESVHASAHYFELFTGSRSTNNINFYERHGYRVSHSKALSEAASITFLIKQNMMKL